MSPLLTVLVLSPPPNTRSVIPEGRGFQASEAAEEKMWETSCDLRRRPGLGPLRRGPGLSAFVATEGSGQEAGTRARGCPGLSGWGAALPASPPSTCCPAGRGAPAWGQESWASPCHCAWLGLRAPPTPLPAVTGGRTVKRDSLGRSVTCWEMDVWGAGGPPGVTLRGERADLGS